MKPLSVACDSPLACPFARSFVRLNPESGGLGSLGAVTSFFFLLAGGASLSAKRFKKLRSSRRLCHNMCNNINVPPHVAQFQRNICSYPCVLRALIGKAKGAS